MQARPRKFGSAALARDHYYPTARGGQLVGASEARNGADAREFRPEVAIPVEGGGDYDGAPRSAAGRRGGELGEEWLVDGEGQAPGSGGGVKRRQKGEGQGQGYGQRMDGRWDDFSWAMR